MRGFSTLLIPPELRDDVLYGAAEIIEREVMAMNGPSTSTGTTTTTSSKDDPALSGVRTYYLHLLDEEERQEKIQQLGQEEQQLMNVMRRREGGQPPRSSSFSSFFSSENPNHHHANDPFPSPDTRREADDDDDDDSRRLCLQVVQCRRIHESYLDQIQWAREVVQKDAFLSQWLTTSSSDPSLWPSIEKLEEAGEVAAALHELANHPPEFAAAANLRRALHVLHAEAAHPGLYTLLPAHVSGELTPYFTSSSSCSGGGNATENTSLSSSTSASVVTYLCGDPVALQGGGGARHPTPSSSPPHSNRITSTLFRVQTSLRVFSTSDLIEQPLTAKAMISLLRMLTPPAVPPVECTRAGAVVSLSVPPSCCSSSSLLLSCPVEALKARWDALTRLHLSYLKKGSTRLLMGTVQEMLFNWFCVTRSPNSTAAATPSSPTAVGPAEGVCGGIERVVDRSGGGRLVGGGLAAGNERLTCKRETGRPGGGRGQQEQQQEEDEEGYLAQRLQQLPRILDPGSFPSPSTTTSSSTPSSSSSHVEYSQGRVRLLSGVYASVFSCTHVVVVFLRGPAEFLGRMQDEENSILPSASLPSFAPRVLQGGERGGSGPILRGASSSFSSSAVGEGGKSKHRGYCRLETSSSALRRFLPPSIRASLEGHLHMTVKEALGRGILLLVGKPFSSSSSFSVQEKNRMESRSRSPPPPSSIIANTNIATAEESSPPKLEELEAVLRRYVLSPVVLDCVGEEAHVLLPPTEERKQLPLPAPPSCDSRYVEMEKKEDEDHVTTIGSEEALEVNKDKSTEQKSSRSENEAREEEEKGENGGGRGERRRVWCSHQQLPLPSGSSLPHGPSSVSWPRQGDGGGATTASSFFPTSTPRLRSDASSALSFAYRFRIPFNPFLLFHGRHVEGGWQCRLGVLERMKREREEHLEEITEEAWRQSLRRPPAGGEERGGSAGGVGASPFSVGGAVNPPLSPFGSPTTVTSGMSSGGVVPLAGAALRTAVEHTVIKVLAMTPLSRADLLAHPELQPYAASSNFEPVVKAVLRDRAQYRGRKYELLE